MSLRNALRNERIEEFSVNFKLAFVDKIFLQKEKGK